MSFLILAFLIVGGFSLIKGDTSDIAVGTGLVAMLLFFGLQIVLAITLASEFLGYWVYIPVIIIAIVMVITSKFNNKKEPKFPPDI